MNKPTTKLAVDIQIDGMDRTIDLAETKQGSRLLAPIVLR